MTTQNMTATAQRQIGAWLFLGIVLMPFLFAWLTLRSGYSKSVRIVSFGWMAVLVALPYVVDKLPSDWTSGSASSSVSNSSEPPVAHDPALSGGFVATMVKQHLSDPDSARFSNVMAYSSGDKLTYCGEVNSKNRMGGYAGPTPFILADSGIFIGDEATAQRLDTECRGQTRTEVRFFDGK